jgi:hypothetical protein
LRSSSEGRNRPAQQSEFHDHCGHGVRVRRDTRLYLVVAHEWGHAIQARLNPDIQAVRRELQADCLAGAAIFGASLNSRRICGRSLRIREFHRHRRPASHNGLALAVGSPQRLGTIAGPG